MTKEAPRVEFARHWQGLADEHLRWGGYPALERLPEAERVAWLRDFRRTYLERDLADLGRAPLCAAPGRDRSQGGPPRPRD